MRKKLRSASLIKLGLVTLLSVGLIDLPLAGGESDSNIVTKYYWVKDGKVDASTFIGWSLFHNTCVGCHGVGGVGTELAPDLTESVSALSTVEFTTKVLHRYSMPVGDRTDMTNAMMAEVRKDEMRESGELAKMPEWKNNPLVRAHVRNIYSYLKARHDGVIGPEKPELMPAQD